MKLDKLAKQARRDLLANPKKAALLGLMVLVALYFWAPMVWKWAFPAGAKKGAANQTALILEDDPIDPAAKPKTGKSAPFRWEKVRQFIQNDRLMVPAVFESDWPNPFALPKVEPPPGETTEGETARGPAGEQLKADPSPGEAGLKLTMVVIGPKRRTAIINGDAYREGETISVQGNDPAPSTGVEFVLVRVEQTGVELERKGKTFRLEFDQPKLARGDEIEPTDSGDRD